MKMKNNISIIKKRTLIVLPNKGISAGEQLDNCIYQLDEEIKKLKLEKKFILKQHIFFKEENPTKFLMKKEMFQDLLNMYYIENIPPTSVIAQAPAAAGIEAAMEVTIAENTDYEIDNRIAGDTTYKVIRNKDYKEVFACGLTLPSLSADIREQSEISFEKMETILDNEGLDFSSVIRQWNYIENILRIGRSNHKSQQNYQIFNDVRTKYYKKSIFTRGYPAATGIGMSTGGVVIDFIASSNNENIQVNSVKNPRQIDAHQYSKDVLVGESGDKKTSPKFERAKAVSNHQSGEIYISGTAAIRGENTIEQKEINSQTAATIENINELLTADNLIENVISLFTKQVIISSLRIYIKNRDDFLSTATICEQSFPQVPSLYLIADICRDDLLVEIEGKANF
jgi:enamine deaminase RidA (YjgF/YER057c/UK114 family)